MTPVIYNNEWLANNYETYKSKVVAMNIYDPDSFHDTFIDVSGKESQTWDVFITSYKKQYSRHINEAMKYITPSPVFWQLLPMIENEPDNGLEIHPRKLELQLRFILNKADFRLIQYRYFMDMTLQEVADYIGMSIKKINESLTRILKQIREYFNRKNEIA